MDEKRKRCFGDESPVYADYHDKEWGISVHDDRHLFEMLSLELSQAGLRWEMILKKREGYRKQFHRFNPESVASMSDRDLEEVLKSRSVVRNRRKIFSIRDNAKIFLNLQQKHGTFDNYIWQFVNYKPIVNHWKQKGEVPCSSPISDKISTDLKGWGMVFIGSRIVYSFMQAVGMVNDHLIDCPYRF